MAKNDMEIIIYKALKYLYECMLEGKTPDMADMGYNSKLFQIPETYWQKVMLEMVDNGFIKGLSILKTKDGMAIVDNGIGITLHGVEYLHENSGMKKAKEFLGSGFDIVIENLIKMLIG